MSGTGLGLFKTRAAADGRFAVLAQISLEKTLGMVRSHR
jgi:hypothetical protein